MEAAGDGVRLLILTDSSAAIAAIRKAGQEGKARTADVRQVVAFIAKREYNRGKGTIGLLWVKAHMGIFGNERADDIARMRATRYCPGPLQITEGASGRFRG